MNLATIAQSDLKIFTLDSGGLASPPQSCAFKGAQLSSLAWNHTNQVLAVAGNKPIVSLVQANNGQLLSTIPFSAEQAFTGPVQALAFSSNSRYLASASGTFVHLWDLKRRNMKAYFGEAAGVVSSLAIAPDGDLVAGDASGAVRLWDMKQQCRVLPAASATGGAQASVTCLQLSCMGPSRLASGYSNGTLAVWDYATGEMLRTQVAHPSHTLTGLAYSPKNARLVVTVGTDGRVALVDTGTRSSEPPSATIEVGDRLTCVSFHEDAIRCAVGTSSGYALIFDWRNVRKPVAKIDAHMPYAVTAMAFTVPKAAASSSSSVASSSAASTPGKQKASVSVPPPTPTPTPTPNPTLTSPGRKARSDLASSVSSLSVGSSSESLPTLGGGSGMRSSLPMPPSPGRGDKAKGVGSSDDKPAAVTPAPPTASLTGLLRGLSPIQSGSTASTSTAQSGAVDIAPSPSPSPITVANTAGVALAATARSSKDKGMGGGGEGFAPISANIFAAPATKTPSPVAVPAVQSVDLPIPSIPARQPQSAAPPPSKPSGGNVSASSATTKPKTP